MALSDGLDAGAVRGYRIALARAMMAEELRRRLAAPDFQGSAEVGIAMSAAGQLLEVRLLRSSGSASVDAALAEAVGEAARHAAIPAAMRGREFVIALPVEIGATR